MRYIRVCYMCPKCNQMIFFDKSNEFSTLCETCNIEMVCVEEKFTSTEEEERKEKIRNSSCVITCPYCQSTNTKKIGVVGRSVSFGLFGFGSGKVGKQWHCNSCGSDF